MMIVVGLLFTGSGLSAQTLDFSGFIDSYHAVRLRPPNDFMSSRSRLRAELKANPGKFLAVCLHECQPQLLASFKNLH